MKNLEIHNITELDLFETININGGSEFTDAIWYGIGSFFGQAYNVLKMTSGTAL